MRARIHILRECMDKLSAWMPVVLMGLFALGTWWLVRSAPKLVSAPPQQVSADPDYFMNDFSVRIFEPDGRLRYELVSVEGSHYPLDDRMEVLKPRLRSLDENGHPIVATAELGISNKDASEIKLYGNARVVREAISQPSGKQVPRLEFRGEFLHAYINEKRVVSDQPVQLWRGKDIFTGNEFDYSDKEGVAHLTGRVRGVLQPRPRTHGSK